jgi:hypothetical protein
MASVPVENLIMASICPECGRLTLSFLDQKPDARHMLARVPGGGEYYSKSLTERSQEYRTNKAWAPVEELCLPHGFHFTFYCEQRPLTKEMLDQWSRSDKHYDTRHGSVRWSEHHAEDLNMRGPLLIRQCHQCGPPVEQPFVEVIEMDLRIKHRVSTG